MMRLRSQSRPMDIGQERALAGLGHDKIAHMGMSQRTRRFAAWIACFSILLAALAPSVSHALATGSRVGSLWSEICSATSPKLIKTDDGKTSNSSSSSEIGMYFDDCPYCCTHAGSSGLPPSPTFTFPFVRAALLHPSLFYQSPRPLFVWATAQSRAPPALS
jgi:hypothetical protein